MSQKTSCPYCGTTPTIHWLDYTSAVFDSFMAPLFAPLNVIRKIIEPRIESPLFDKVLYMIARGITFTGIGKLLTSPDDRMSYRTRCMWDEAVRRRITMQEFRVFGKSSDLLFARYNGHFIAFQGLPRPDGKESESLPWMDNKGIMREKFHVVGIPVARGGVCSSLSQAEKLFDTIHGTVIAKPVTGSRSRHTTIHIATREGLRSAFAIANQLSPRVVIEEELKGMVFRATLINGRLAAVMRREPPHVVGDGISTIAKLIETENKNLKRNGPIFHHLPTQPDAEAEQELARQDMTWDSIPPKGHIAILGQKVGRGGGASTSDVTNDVHPVNRELFEKIGRVLADPLVGIDFIIEDMSHPWTEQAPCGVIECNSCPFIDLHHYPLRGEVRNVAGMLWDIIFPESAQA